jgi:norsolorinic acid ketoreductase
MMQGITTDTRHSMVRTDMGNKAFAALKEQGVDLTPFTISVEESTRGLMKTVEGASLEKTHGKFLGPDGEELQW